MKFGIFLPVSRHHCRARPCRRGYISSVFSASFLARGIVIDARHCSAASLPSVELPLKLEVSSTVSESRRCDRDTAGRALSRPGPARRARPGTASEPGQHQAVTQPEDQAPGNTFSKFTVTVTAASQAASGLDCVRPSHCQRPGLSGGCGGCGSPASAEQGSVQCHTRTLLGTQ
jgi:hypothetical protein